jgi:hypothetical protein
MKDKISFPCLALALVIAMVTFTQCKREVVAFIPPAGPTDSIPKPNVVKGKVLEYGSDLPLAGASVSICTNDSSSVSCGDQLSLFTDNNGECSFDTKNWSRAAASKEGYWLVNDQCLVTNYKDSFVIRLIPTTLITVHLKELPSIKGQGHMAMFYRSGIWGKISDSNIIPFNQCGEWISVPQGVVYLHENIDTTFQLIAYGNAFNVLKVTDLSEEEWEHTGNEYYFEYMYIPNRSNYNLDITYP